MQSLVEGDEAQFKRDMSILICMPIYTIALALNAFAAKKLNKMSSNIEIELTMGQATVDPIQTKLNLIRICDNQIFLLRSKGETISFIGNKK